MLTVWNNLNLYRFMKNSYCNRLLMLTGWEITFIYFDELKLNLPVNWLFSLPVCIRINACKSIGSAASNSCVSLACCSRHVASLMFENISSSSSPSSPSLLLVMCFTQRAMGNLSKGAYWQLQLLGQLSTSSSICAASVWVGMATSSSQRC